MKSLQDLIESVLDVDLDVEIPEVFDYDFWSQLGQFKPVKKEKPACTDYDSLEPINIFCQSKNNIEQSCVRNISQARRLVDGGANTCAMHVSIGKRRNKEWCYKVELVNCSNGHSIVGYTYQYQVDNGTKQWRQACRFVYKMDNSIFVDAKAGDAARCVFHYYELPLPFFGLIKSALKL